MSLPIAFAEPMWLALAIPVVALVVVGWMSASRTLPRARRVASLVIRLTLVTALVLALAGARLALPSDRLSVVFLLDGSASMLDATTRRARRLGARQCARDARGRHGRRRGLRRERARRSPAVTARRALRPGLGAGGRGHRRGGGRAPGRGDPSRRHAAANRAPVRWQRHRGRGRRRDRGCGGPRHPARRGVAGGRVGGGGPRRRRRRAARRARRRDDRPRGPASLDRDDGRHAAPPRRRRDGRHARARARAGRSPPFPSRSRPTSPASTSSGP